MAKSSSPVRSIALGITLLLVAYHLPSVMQFLALQIAPLNFLTDSSVYFAILKYHRSSLPEVEPSMIPEIHDKDLTQEVFLELTKNMRYPLVIRDGLDKQKIAHLGKRETWSKTYSKESDWLICSDNMQRKYFKCPPSEVMNSYNNKSTTHADLLRGQASHYILYNNPDLMEAMYTRIGEWIPRGSLPPQKYSINEMFLAVEGTETPLHGAMGLNIFKQIAGRKRWMVVDPADNYIAGMVNNEKNQGTTVRTVKGMVLHEYDDWLKKVPRQVATLNPGDILFVPSWWSHTIQNVVTDPPAELTIGCPERYGYVANSFLNSNFLSAQAILRKGASMISLKMSNRFLGTDYQMAQDFMPLHVGDNAAKFDTYLIDNNVVKSTSGYREGMGDEDW